MATDEPLTQANRRIKITTVLDKNKKPGADDPLLPAIVQCSEAVSTPYYIDLLMYASRDFEIKPESIINTAATVSVRVENFVRDREAGSPPPTYTYQLRKGVFQSFQRQDRFHRRVGRDVNVYTGRLVPAFMIMDQEVRYRIFEQQDMTFCDIIQACMTSFKGLNLTNYVDVKALQALKDLKDPLQPPPKMEHCVQYGESTFNFLSRLMARFSIWYYFDHDASGTHELMVLGSGPYPGGSQGFKQCTVVNNYPDPRDIEQRIPIDNWQIVTGLARLYTPAPRLTRTSDFNPVIPTNPPQSNDEASATHLDDKYDIINTADGTDQPWKQVTQCAELPPTTFIQEQFPDSTIYDDGDATNDAQTTMQVAEGQVFTATAATKNASFCAARRFNYLKGDDNTKTTEFLITRMSLNAYERYYLQYVHHDTSFSALIDDVLVAPVASFLNQLGSSTMPDLANAMSGAGLQEYTQNWIETSPPSAKPAFSTYFGTGALMYLASFLPSTTTVLQDLLGLLLGFFTLLVETVRHIADALLFLPGLLIPALKRARLAMDHGIDEFERSVKKFIDKLRVRDDDGCSVSFVAVPLDHGKLGVPLPNARNAQVFGPHLATVIGPNGIDTKAGELWADALGRVRVRFPWDRTPWEGTKAKASNDGSAKPQFAVGVNTAWVRVSEAWAGQKFGTQFLPRIGQEVVVSFIDSDPDRPIITGRVYNANTGTTNLPFPPSSCVATSISQLSDTLNLYKTASADFARGGIETRSTPMPRDAQGKPSGKIGYHLLRFDDTYGNEQLLLRSQGRMDVTAKSSHYDTTVGDRHVLCISGYDKITDKTSNGDLFVTTGYNYWGKPPHGNYDLHVGGSRFEKVDGTDFGYQLTVEKDMQLDVEKNCSAIIKENLSFNAKNIVLEAEQKITLRVGQSTLVLSPSTHYLDGPMICKQQDGPADPVPDLTFQDVMDAVKADPGEPASTRAASHGGKGGGRGSHPVTAQHALGCGMDADNMVSVDMPQLCGADGDGE